MAKWMNEFVRMAVCSVDHPDFLVEVGGKASGHRVAGAGHLSQRDAGRGAPRAEPSGFT